MKSTTISTGGGGINSNSSGSNGGNVSSGGGGGGSYFSSIFGSNDHQTKVERPTKVESTPNDIPKEELLQLCMKLNKRLQALETKHSDLLQKHQIITQERLTLFDLLKSSINERLVLENDQNNNVEYIKEKWIQLHQEEKNRIQKLQEEVKLYKRDNNNCNNNNSNNNQSLDNIGNHENSMVK